MKRTLYSNVVHWVARMPVTSLQSKVIWVHYSESRSWVGGRGFFWLVRSESILDHCHQLHFKQSSLLVNKAGSKTRYGPLRPNTRVFTVTITEVDGGFPNYSTGL